MTIESINGKKVPSPISFGWQQQDVNTNDSDRLQIWNNDCRKIGADLYIDDKAVRPEELGGLSL